MTIRPGTVSEMLSLWQTPASTSRFFAQCLKRKKAEFWTVEQSGRPIAELYLFWEIDSLPGYANGIDTAYLCAFRVQPAFRHQGIGTALALRVLDRIRERGFSWATIGVDPQEEANLRLYRRLGFTQELKFCREDPCDVDDAFCPQPCPGYLLLRKDLNAR